MPIERRDQQNLDLVEGTQSVSNSSTTGQKELTQFETSESWKTRISFRAQDKNCTFSNLTKHINVEVLREAFKAINGKKALGVDQISKSAYGKNLDENLENLAMRIQRGTYRPIPKREVLIPKANGKMRPIAIASFEDKLVD